jgi:formamidopyrimidine-DNA glycosylase
MMELPEAAVIAGQISSAVSGKRIALAVANQSPHKFAWFTGDPATYNDRLAGKVIQSSTAYGGMVEVHAGDTVLALSTALRYFEEGDRLPQKHQLLLTFEDGTVLVATVHMWGCLACFPEDGDSGIRDYELAKQQPSPLNDTFSSEYFKELRTPETSTLSAKAFLATEQRIPGLGNGVLQDILWAAHVHPRSKMERLGEDGVHDMYRAVRAILSDMVKQGGRDTEKDLFGRPGRYRTILSRNTVGTPCPACGTEIQKQAYLGGSIYFCGACQPRLD